MNVGCGFLEGRKDIERFTDIHSLRAGINSGSAHVYLVTLVAGLVPNPGVGSNGALRSLIALVSIFVESSRVDDVMRALSTLENVEDTYEVTGEFDIVSVVSARDIHEFRDILKNRILRIDGVKSTVTSIVLNPHNGFLH